MLQVAFAIALSFTSPMLPAEQGLILAQASPGPSKTGFYVVDLTCPIENGDLIIMQMNQNGQATRTKGILVEGYATAVTIETAEKQGDDFKLLFPYKNKFTDAQKNTVTNNIRNFLKTIYDDVCIDKNGNREKFLARIGMNKARLGASTP